MLRPAIFAAALLAAAPACAAPFTFIALGDMPYGKPEKVFEPFARLIEIVNARQPAFVLHVGDTKSGSTPCDDAMLDAQLGFLNDFAAPTLYTPGDNEWTDCHRKKAGEFDPLERLAYIRNTYFNGRDTTFGQVNAKIDHQGDAGYPENARLMHEGVMVVTAHVVGSNNNFEIRDPKAVAEFFARDAAATAWLTESFAAAADADADAVVLGVHAQMFEAGFNPGKESWARNSGHKRFGQALQKAAAAFGKPVLLIFGDSHKFRVQVPFPKNAPNVMALEVFGAADMHAVEISVDPKAPAPFGFRPVINDALK